MNNTIPAPAISNATYPRAQAWSMTAMVVLFATINWADKAIIGIVAPALREELGFTATQIGYAGSAFFFLFSISGAMVGFLGDRFQLRHILLVLALLWGLIQFPMLLAATAVVLLTTRIVLGAAEGPATAMANAALFQWFPPEKRGFPSALVTAGSSFAKILAAPLLALVLAGWGWRACFAVMGCASFAWCALWFFVGKEGPYSSSVSSHSNPVNTQPKLPLLTIILCPTFIGALIGTFVVYGLVSASITWIPSYFEKGLGYSRLHSGFMFGLPSIFALVTMFASTLIGDRLTTAKRTSRTTRAIATAAFLIAGGGALAALPWLGTPAAVVAVLVFGYGCASVALPMMNAVVSQITPPHQLASTLGIFLALQNLSGLITPTVVGVLVDRSVNPVAGYGLAYQLFGISIIAGGVAIALLVHPDRDAARLKRLLDAKANLR